MGCFSFLCKGCGEPINSDSFRGERCILMLIKDGIILERMNGEYDSYGRVFDENGKSIKWESMKWGDIVTLMFHRNSNNGIIAYHEDCYDPNGPLFRSDDDPNQGWGDFEFPEKVYEK